MTNLFHDAYTALLSGLTIKVGNEIHWYDEWDNPLTIEPVDISDNRYIIRYYYPDKSKSSECEYRDGVLDGKCILWYRNGDKHWEIEYRDGQFHGKVIKWVNRRKYEEEYRNGERTDESIA